MLILQRSTGSDKSELIRLANVETAKSLGVAYESFSADLPDVPGEIQKRLDENEIVLYLDENAIVNPRQTSVDETALDILADKDAAFTIDVGGERDRWNPAGLCASQGLFRGSGKTSAFLAAWKEAAKRRRAQSADRLTLQRALNDIRSQFADTINAIDNYYRFAARDGYFIDQTYLDDAGAVERKLGRRKAQDEPAAETPQPVKKTRRKKTE